MFKHIFTALLALTASFSIAANNSHCDQMLPFGYPTHQVAESTQLCRIAYTVSHDNVRKVPIYSAELLLPVTDTKTVRVNAFKADPDLHPTQRAKLSDYDKTYDRGHMTPFEDTSYNSAAARQTFYLSNIVPQNLHMNRGMWRTLENHVRTWTNATPNGLYVITGPIFAGPVAVIGDGVAVPTHLFKVVIDKQNMQGIGFIIPNAPPKKGVTFSDYKVSISAVERASGLNFTPTLKQSPLKDVVSAEFK